MKYDGKMDYQCCPPKWDCESKCGGKDYMNMDMDTDMDYDCGCMMPPKKKCKVEKTCVKTYKCLYKLYRVCTYRLYKVCPRCSHEFDYHYHRGMCPKCS